MIEVVNKVFKLKEIDGDKIKSTHPYLKLDQLVNLCDAKRYIIGTIPPHRFCVGKGMEECGDIDWFYGSNRNYFWRRVFSIEDNGPRPKKPEIMNFCKENSIYVIDMICSCERMNCTAADSALCNIKLIRISEILKNNKNENIEIFFTSEYAAKLFNDSIGKSIEIRREENPNEFEIESKKIKAYVLYSPSPRAISKASEEWKNDYALLRDKAASQ